MYHVSLHRTEMKIVLAVFVGFATLVMSLRYGNLFFYNLMHITKITDKTKHEGEKLRLPHKIQTVF